MVLKKRYEEAGVSLEEASKTVSRIKSVVKSTFNERVLIDVGAFAALYDASFPELKNPVLVASTDGIGTKILLHLERGTYEEAGQDLVAMCSNDILTLGAEPLFFLDYIAAGRLDSETVASIVEGIAKACKKIGASLIGGETAEMPGLYKEGHYDVSGFIVGILDKEKILDPKKVKPGDIVIGIESSGPHSNGYSLIRKMMDEGQIAPEEMVPGTDKTFIELVMEPTILYHPYLIELFRDGLVKSAANITGGGFFENIPRALPENVDVVIHRSSYRVPPLFSLIMEKAQIEEEEMYAVFNMGTGFVLIVSRENQEDVLKHVAEKGIKSFVLGEVVEGSGRVKMVG